MSQKGYKAGVAALVILACAAAGFGVWEIFCAYTAEAVFSFICAAGFIAACIVTSVLRKKANFDETVSDEEKSKSKQRAKGIAVTAVTVTLFLGVFFYNSIIGYRQDRSTLRMMQNMLAAIETVGLDDYEEIEEVQTAYNALPERLRKQVTDAENIENAFEQYENKLSELAQECDEETKAFQKRKIVFTRSFSSDIESLYSKATSYEVKDRMKYFEDLTDIYEKYCSVREDHRVSCASSIRCEYCDGRGKCAVKWYEFGDWGDVSYTSYKCTDCNGTGHRPCPTCGGAGYYYRYDAE